MIRRLITLFPTIVMAVVLGCAGDSPPPNLLLITVDALRPDHLGIYGYTRDTSPNIDAFFSTGVLYERAYATQGSTPQSVISFLSGLLPQETGLRLFAQKIPEGLELVSDHLARAGYQTAAVVSNGVLTSEAMDLNRHFEYFDDYVDEKENRRNRWERAAGPTTNAALRWHMTAYDREKPFFLWLHYQDPHGPYTAPDDKPKDFKHSGKEVIDIEKVPGYTRVRGLDDGLEYVDRYDEEIAYMDQHVGRLLRFLELDGSLDNTVVIFSADHGESMMEHEQWFTHGHHVYDEVLRVPLIIRYPAASSLARVKTPVSLLDVAPTLLNLARIHSLPPVRGRPLTGSPEEKPLYVQGGRYRAMIYQDKKWVIEVDREWDAPRRVGVFDLAMDPDELVMQPWIETQESEGFFELIASDPDPAGVPREFVAGELPKDPKIHPNAKPKTLKKLRSLGYLK